MPEHNISEKKSKKRGLIVLIVVVVGLLAFLFLQDKKLERQQALKIQFIEEKNALRDDLDDLIDKIKNDLV